MDGQTLTEALHAHGINVRYIGRVGLMCFNCCFFFFLKKINREHLLPLASWNCLLLDHKEFDSFFLTSKVLP